MLKYFSLACAIAFLSVKSVVAQAQEATWVAKPVQCDTQEGVQKVMEDKGLLILGGMQGYTNSANYAEPIPVYVFLGVNPETKEWVIVETGVPADETCIIGYGPNLTIDEDTLRLMTVETY